MPFPFIKYRYTCQNTAADEQQCDPQHEVAVVAGLRRIRTSRLARLSRCSGSRNLNCRLLVAANLALLMLGALLCCGRFLIYHPLEAVCYNIFLIAAGALMPVVVGIVLPLAAVAVSMLTAAGCRDGLGCHRIAADGAFLML